MLGLKTQEENNFIKFFEIVQRTAKRDGNVFFLECEDGNDSEVNGIEVCDLQGWLIPESKVDEFNPIWEKDEVDDEWVDFFKFATWNNENNGLKIKFE